MQIDRRKFMKAMGASLAVSPVISATRANAGSLALEMQGRSRRPNVVLMVCDDLGHGDPRCYGSRLNTPNLDKMAADGTRFTHFNSAHPICSASRAALLTGRYAARMGVPAVYFPHATSGLPTDETTLANLFKQSGYRTMCIGKWHLGDLPQYLPTSRGFDFFYGVPYSIDMKPLPLYRNQVIAEQETDRLTLTPRYTQQAVEFINQASEEPFFLYIAFSYPQEPARASGRYRGKSGLGDYVDSIEEIDWSVGEVFKALERRGAASNTIVFFTSDHGPGNQGSPGLLRGRKGSTLEGGHRIPFLACWPGMIPAGRSIDAWASNLDVLPTLVSLCGLGRSSKPVDGVDISETLLGKTENIERNKAVLYFSCLFFRPNDKSGIRIRDIHCARKDNWKLRVAESAGGLHNLWLSHPDLYNLKEDPA